MRLSHRPVGVFALVLLAGCATGDQAGQDERDRTLVLLGHSDWDGKIADALTKQGLKVAEREDPTAPPARYELTVSFGARVDYCVLNESEKYSSVTYEVREFETKAVVATVRAAGWTGPCLVHWTEVFDELAEKLARKLLGSALTPGR
jgi:hypothetical protein